MSNTQQHNLKEVASSGSPSPPPPPPPPPENPTSKISPVVQNLKTTPPSQYLHQLSSLSAQDLAPAPTGPYFFYGTLSDPTFLCDVLHLDDTLQLRPAKIVGYECRLWGQYPALVDADAESKTVSGYVYRVETQQHARRLAEYETGNYRAEPCRILYTDRGEQEDGYTFRFVGDRDDLSEGTFDLGVWLQRMGRRAGNPDDAAHTDSESYEVYNVQFVGQPNHVALYIETQPDEPVETRKGLKYDVTGTILMGMVYRKQECEDPLVDAAYVPDSKQKVATIVIGDLQRFETECCEVVAPPASQVFINGRRKDPSKPLYRCNHWVDDVVKLAFEREIFKG
ncbi:hypothetical protein BJY00DRAFT_284098 [Aspergillus carlsbadensis]|nr:hypothetical protein BJY00DRAFT_284098 [Aspergillus carlsbadensis]